MTTEQRQSHINSGIPLLMIGTFGVHILLNPAGTYSYFGTVPTAKAGVRYTTQEEGIADFVAWFKSQPTDWQREHVSSLRNDVFELVLCTVA